VHRVVDTHRNPFFPLVPIRGREERKRPAGRNSLRGPFLKRNGQTVRHWLAPGEAVPSTKIPGGTCPAHCGYPPSLVKARLPLPNTGAACMGRCFTAAWYRSTLTGKQDVCLPSLFSSSAESGQLKLATASSKTRNSTQAYPLLGDWVTDFSGKRAQEYHRMITLLLSLQTS